MRILTSQEDESNSRSFLGESQVFCLPPQDLSPYVSLLVPELRLSLIDPLPEVRATAAKALGSLLRGMGQEHFQDLMPWLLETVKSEVRAPRPGAHVLLWLSSVGSRCAVRHQEAVTRRFLGHRRIILSVGLRKFRTRCKDLALPKASLR